MANLKNVIYLSNEDYETLVSTGTVTIDGETLTYDENNVYITPDKLASTTEDGLMSATDKSKLNNIESGAQVNVQSDWNQTDTGADDYIKNKPEVDTDFSLTSTNALQNKVISEKLEYIDYALTHIKYKLFGVTTLSEIDHKVDYATIYPIPETLSDDDGTHRVVYSDTQLKEIEGNSVASNQLVNMPNGSLQNYQGNANSLNKNITFDPNHYYLFKVNVNFQTQPTPKYCVLLGMWSNDGSWYRRCLFTYQSNGIYQSILLGKNLDGSGDLVIKSGLKAVLQLYGNSTDTTYPQYSNSQIIDLTQMFGAGNEPTTVEEFNRIFPLTYYPHNVGEIKNTVIKGIKVNGYNLFDGIFERGDIDSSTGEETTDNRFIRSGNFIKVIAGQTYSLEQFDFAFFTTAQRKIVQFDENKNVIKATTNFNNDGQFANPYTITLESNCRYVRIVYYNGETQIPLDLKCVFHRTGTRTGYAPYKEPHIINIPQTELKSAYSIHDTIKFVEGNIVAGQQRYDMVQVSRINNVDLGTLDYTKQSSYTASATGLQSLIKKPSAYNVKAEALCSKYVTVAEGDIKTSDKSVAISADNGIFLLNDSAYADYTEQQIKTAMSNVILNYEKAEPTETTLATDLTFEEVSAIIEQGGSIETIFEIVPPNLKTAFVVNKVIVS